MSDLNPAEYYATTFPAQYQAALADADAAILDQPELSANIEIPGQGIFGLRAQGKTLTYEPGGVANPDLHTTLSHQDWSASIQSGAAEQLIDYILRRRVHVVKGINGTVKLELERSDGSMYHNTTTFMGQQEPAVTIMMTSDDYNAMMNGDLNGQMAFMMGKLKFEGSLPLLMAIGALAS